MRPILLKGHERAITMLKYNRDGDLLFTSSKAHFPCVWFAESGERLGTYNGHTGAVWCLDVNWDSTRLFTGAADQSARYWDVETGDEIARFPHDTPVRSVGFSEGDKLIFTVTDQVMRLPPTIRIWDLNSKPSSGPIKEIVGSQTVKINQAAWGPLNKTIIACSEDGSITTWNPESGEKLQHVTPHSKSINRITFAKDQLTFVSASSDYSAKLFDTETLEVKKTYETDRPVNASAISPLMEHVILGGGQEAIDVTKTHSRVGHFQTKFYHKIFENEIGTVKGHFGPIHTLSFSPDGKSFASGAEDGYIRIHHLDSNYFKLFADDLINP
jgi:translation initiation factor 3 subunit I